MKKLFLLLACSLLFKSCEASDLSVEVLKRGNLVYGYDFKDHEAINGLMSPLVLYKDLSLDWGGVRDSEKSDEYDIAAGLSFHVGKFLSRKSGIEINLPEGLLNKFFVSAYVSPVKLETSDIQFRRLVAHYGFYGGLQISF